MAGLHARRLGVQAVLRHGCVPAAVDPPLSARALQRHRALGTCVLPRGADGGRAGRPADGSPRPPEKVDHEALEDSVTGSRRVPGVGAAAGAIIGGGVGALPGAIVGGIAGGLGINVGSWLGSLMGFAEGGVVNKPTISLVGEAGPEAIIPLNRLNDYSIGQEVYAPQISVSASIGSDYDVRNLAEELNRQLYVDYKRSRMTWA